MTTGILETIGAHGSVWGDFPISCTIQENGSSRAFEGILGWTAHPQAPGLKERDVLLHFAEANSDAEIGDTSPGGCLSFDCDIVNALADNDESAKKAVMDRIQEAWSGLVSYSLPPA